jgi:SAM domain (Sterile alpha motif)/Adenylate and Guanylate cyclase catalytic domain
MQEVADWLEKLGLRQYAQRFAENDISISVLPDLTDQDLREIGVSLGHRRQLLRAITELTSPPKPTAGSAAPAASQDTAERRQVTVMFSDLVGSTALSARMDPEDLREVISASQKSVAETVQRFGGFVAKYMGDGALVEPGRRFGRLGRSPTRSGPRRCPTIRVSAPAGGRLESSSAGSKSASRLQ